MSHDLTRLKHDLTKTECLRSNKVHKEPNRLNAIAGAAKAADLLGDKAKAKDYYQKLTTIAGNADTIRPDLAAARAFLAKN